MPVRFYFMRHGEKPLLDAGPPERYADDITERGERQIEAAVKKLFLDQAGVVYRDINLVRIYHSDKFRTVRSMAVAGNVLARSGYLSTGAMIEVKGAHELVSLGTIGTLPGPSFEEVEYDLRAHYGDRLTAGMWLESWAPAQRFRENLIRFMTEVVLEPRFQGDGWYDILIGSHSPFAELAASNASEIGPMGYADTCVYLAYNKDGEVKIKPARIFKAPAVD